MTALEGPLVGKDAKLYYNSATHASPTWVLIENVQDLSMPLERDKADVSTRRSQYKMYAEGQIDAGVEFGMLYDPGDADYQTLKAAFHAVTAMQFAIMDQAIATTGAEGLRAFCKIFGFPLEEGLNDGAVVTVTIAPVYHYESAALVLPDWYVVSGA